MVLKAGEFVSIDKVNIAFCFNNETQAISLGSKLSEISPEINIITSPTFDGFLRAIALADKIDYFVIDETFFGCDSSELISKLKASKLYKKSLFSLFAVNHKKIDKKFLAHKMDFIFDVKTDIHAVFEGLETSMLKSSAPLIPKHFNVLAIDDESGILELIAMNIIDLGHSKIEVSNSVFEAKKLLLQKDFDLILLDWNIGDGTCMDVMEYIKRTAPISARTKAALIMVITGRDSVDDIMMLVGYGVKDTIIKPFDSREFEDKISYALEKHLKKVAA